MKMLLVIGLLILAFCSCKKEPKPGKGGTYTIRAVPTHFGKLVDYCKIYIAYGARSAPDHYDDSLDCTMINDTTMAIFTGLKAGHYYLHGSGVDGGQGVSGEIQVSLNIKSVINAYVPVYGHTEPL